MGLRFF